MPRGKSFDDRSLPVTSNNPNKRGYSQPQSYSQDSSLPRVQSYNSQSLPERSNYPENARYSQAAPSHQYKSLPQVFEPQNDSDDPSDEDCDDTESDSQSLPIEDSINPDSSSDESCDEYESDSQSSPIKDSSEQPDDTSDEPCEDSESDSQSAPTVESAESATSASLPMDQLPVYATSLGKAIPTSSPIGYDGNNYSPSSQAVVPILSGAFSVWEMNPFSMFVVAGLTCIAMMG